jgi:hypothetical protein
LHRTITGGALSCANPQPRKQLRHAASLPPADTPNVQTKGQDQLVSAPGWISPWWFANDEAKLSQMGSNRLFTTRELRSLEGRLSKKIPVGCSDNRRAVVPLPLPFDEVGSSRPKTVLGKKWLSSDGFSLSQCRFYGAMCEVGQCHLFLQPRPTIHGLGQFQSSNESYNNPPQLPTFGPTFWSALKSSFFSPGSTIPFPLNSSLATTADA